VCVCVCVYACAPKQVVNTSNLKTSSVCVWGGVKATSINVQCIPFHRGNALHLYAHIESFQQRTSIKMTPDCSLSLSLFFLARIHTLSLSPRNCVTKRKATSIKCCAVISLDICVCVCVCVCVGEREKESERKRAREREQESERDREKEQERERDSKRERERARRRDKERKRERECVLRNQL